MADEDTAQEATPAPTTPEPTQEVAASVETPTPAPTEQTAPEVPTAQIPANEPIGLESAPVDGPLPPEPESISHAPEPPQTAATSAPVAPAPVATHPARDLLVKARATIQDRKRKKLDKILEALTAKGKITNDEVEKLLHVSDATATRYLSALEKEGKLKQIGTTGKAVVYTGI